MLIQFRAMEHVQVGSVEIQAVDEIPVTVIAAGVRVGIQVSASPRHDAGRSFFVDKIFQFVGAIGFVRGLGKRFLKLFRGDDANDPGDRNWLVRSSRDTQREELRAVG